jgi:flagellar hook-associated protein 3 FlgL
MTIAYGMRANEQAISTLVANVAVLAATTYSASDPNARTSYRDLSQSVAANLDGKAGTQTITDIEANLANAQTTVANATTSNAQTQNRELGIHAVQSGLVGEARQAAG